MEPGGKPPAPGRQSLHETTSSDHGRRPRRVRGAAQLSAAVLPPVLTLLALLVVVGSSESAWSRPWPLLGWCLVAILATMYRPFPGAGLGAGAIVIVPLLHLHGAAPAALVAGIAVLAGDLIRRLLASGLGLADERPLTPVFERAMLSVFSVLVATTAQAPFADGRFGDGGLAALWLAPLLYFVCLAASTLVLDWLRHVRRPSLAPVGSSAFELVGWMIGAGLLAVAEPAGWTESFWIWPLCALLTGEAGRQQLLRRRADRRLDSYEQLHRAHERILAESSGMGGIAEQIHIECRNVLPLQWFQFELPAADDAEGAEGASWAAGPDSHLVEGRPRPPQRPQMLPGIHRRATWRVIERQLILQTPEGEDETLATIRMWCDPRRVETGAEELLDTLLPQMAASVHRARLDREARLDPLTGVPVRRVLEAGLQRAYRRTCDDGTPMAVIMCDIDFFKRVNDTWGHDAGDEALKSVAHTLDATRREGDLCCRYGGEEFTLLLERTDGLAALQLAERLRRAVEAIDFVYDGQSIPLTLSLGVAAFPEIMVKTASELQLLADEALYEAKERGRNQSLLNVGNGAFLAPPGVPRQESSTVINRPPLPE